MCIILNSRSVCFVAFLSCVTIVVNVERRALFLRPFGRVVDKDSLKCQLLSVRTLHLRATYMTNEGV